MVVLNCIGDRYRDVLGQVMGHISAKMKGNLQ